MATIIQTADHGVIKRWTEERKGQPAVQNESTNDNVTGVLRIKFEIDESHLKPISWEEFFKEFDENGMMFLCNDATDDHYYKFVYDASGD